MKQRQREQVQRGCAVGTVVLLAWLCRVLPLEGMPSGLQEACGILRLCNRQMFRVYRALSGRDLQSLKELYQQVWAPAPEAPVLPVVQDARPDPAPAPAPAPAPETPVLPAVQDAKLIQTGTSGWLADLMLGAGMVLSAAGPHAAASPRRVPQALRGFFVGRTARSGRKKQGCSTSLWGSPVWLREVGARASGGSGRGAAQRAVFFSSGASGLFSRFSSGISSLLMMVSICSSFFTSSLGKRLFTRWTTVLR